MVNLTEVLRVRLKQRQKDDLYRKRKVCKSPAFICKQQRVNFASNNYLGLASDPRLIEAWKQGLDRYGVGSSASSLVTGYSDAHEELEQALAAFTGYEAAILFNSGYVANISLLTSLLQKNDLLVADKLVHASLLDGSKLSQSRMKRYTHADLQQAERLICTKAEGSKYLLTEGVFSMDGDLPDLPGLSSLCEKHEASLMVDDAHGLGVLGKTGRGSIEYHAMTRQQVPVLTAGLGKAFGVAGGFVAGPKELCEILVQYARPYVYSTAMPAAQAVALLEALSLVENADAQRTALMANIALYRKLAEEEGLPLSPSVSPVQPLILGSNKACLRVAEHLSEKNYDVIAIRPPTVPENTARLRISLSSEHDADQIQGLVQTLAEAVRSIGQ